MRGKSCRSSQSTLRPHQFKTPAVVLDMALARYLRFNFDLTTLTLDQMAPFNHAPVGLIAPCSSEISGRLKRRLRNIFLFAGHVVQHRRQPIQIPDNKRSTLALYDADPR
jgi:hypothetical protein